MIRTTFVLKLTADRAAGIAAVQAMQDEFRKAGLENFSVWHMQQYLFGYGENGETAALASAFEQLPAGVELVCAPGTMRQMYHDIGIVRQDKSLIRHRVFATKLKPNCEEEYKLRHDRLVEARRHH